MKVVKVISVTFLVLLVFIQFIPRKINRHTTETEGSFSNVYEIPVEIERQLRISCFDCHSNNTDYPWYSNIQPINMLINNHVKKGKAELNFDVFDTYSKRKKRAKIKSIINQIKDSEMPLKSYEIVHRDARVSQNNKDNLIRWLNTLIE